MYFEHVLPLPSILPVVRSCVPIGHIPSPRAPTPPTQPPIILNYPNIHASYAAMCSSKRRAKKNRLIPPSFRLHPPCRQNTQPWCPGAYKPGVQRISGHSTPAHCTVISRLNTTPWVRARTHQSASRTAPSRHHCEPRLPYGLMCRYRQRPLAITLAAWLTARRAPAG